VRARSKLGTLVAAAWLCTAPAVLRAETPPSAPGQPPAQETAEPVKVEGFRAAHFGMTEAQVSAAIQKDFGVAESAIVRGENAAEKTQNLTVTVKDLLSGGGPARVGYVFGYRSKRLIQVNVVWGSEIDPKAKAESVLNIANALRDYFLAAGYKSDSVVANAKLANGSIVVFRGEDQQSRMTLLVLTGGPAEKAAGEQAQPQPISLKLSYILDHTNPDIFRIPRGQF